MNDKSKSSGSSDDSGSFYDFVQLVKDITNESSHTGKTKIMKEFLKTFKGDTYLLYKLLIPKSNQRVFNIKEKAMIKLCAKIFDADVKEMNTDFEQGDVSETVKKFYKRSNLDIPSRSTLTLKKVDRFLDKLTTVTKSEDQTEVLNALIERATPDDLKYVTRLIMGDLKSYAGPKFLLQALHPDAYQAFVVSHDLKAIIEAVTSNNQAALTQLTQSQSQDDNAPAAKSFMSDSSDSEDEKYESDSDDENNNNKKKKEKTKDSASSSSSLKKSKLDLISVKINTAIKPMLAKPSKSVQDTIKRCPNGFFTEIKYDGERIQVHKSGDKFTFYSRNLKPIQEHKVADVKEYILKSTDAKSIILDGEILLIDVNTGLPLPFGSLNKHKKTKYKDAQPAIFFFDILFLNGESLLNVPMKKRRKMLEQNVKTIKNRILLSELVVAEGSDEDMEAILADRMNTAISQGLEGLVIKDINGVYEPAARHWLKMKKDYLKGMADSADLVVLGAYYGTGSKGGLMSVFLMGCYDKQSGTYKTVCKVGNGHDDDTILKLNKELEKNMVKIQKDYSLVPSWLDVDRMHVPDFVCKDPLKSVVWEIAGAEFSKSTNHTADGLSIRFPRVTRIRDDKDVKDATTLSELKELQKTSLTKAQVGIATHLKQSLPKVGTSASSSKKDKSDSDSDSDSDSNKSDSDSDKKNKQKKVVKSDNDSDNEGEDNKTATLEYIKGDVTKPVDSHGFPCKRNIIVHSVDNSGKWSQRGIMGAIQRAFGNVPMEHYEKCKKDDNDCDLGDIQCIKIDQKDNNNCDLYICNLIGQKAKKGGPPVDYPAFEKALKKLAAFCRKHEPAIVHFAKLHPSTPGLVWEKIEKLIENTLLKEGVPVFVYGNQGKSPQDIKPAATAAATAKAPNDAAGSDNEHDVSMDMTITADDVDESSKKRKSAQISRDNASDTDADKTAAASKNNSQNSDNDNKKYRGEDGTSALMDIDDVGGAQVKNVFANVYAVIDGFSASDADEIKELIKRLGGNIQSKWSVVGATASTHLICESSTSEVFSHVSLLGGKIVTKRWVEECAKQNKLVPETLHLFVPAPPAPPPTTTATTQNTKSSSQQQRDPNISSSSNNNDSDLGPKFELANVFGGCVVYLYSGVNKANLVKRYLIAYGADVVDSYSEHVSHIVTDSKWDNNLQDFLCDEKNNHNLKIVRSAWVWDSVNELTKIQEKKYIVTRPKRK